MDELNKTIMKKYPIENMTETPFYFPKEPEPVLRQLLFMLEKLISSGYTLSVICPRQGVVFKKGSSSSENP